MIDGRLIEGVIKTLKEDKGIDSIDVKMAVYEIFSSWIPQSEDEWIICRNLMFIEESCDVPDGDFDKEEVIRNLEKVVKKIKQNECEK